MHRKILFIYSISSKENQDSISIFTALSEELIKRKTFVYSFNCSEFINICRFKTLSVFSSKINELLFKKRLSNLLNEVSPDLILSLNPYLNRTILNILRKDFKEIRFGTIIPELANIHSVWLDKRCSFIICPTEQSMNICIEKYKFNSTKLKLMGFPVRTKFCHQFINPKKLNKFDGPLEFLLIYSSNNFKAIRSIICTILENCDSKVNIITGKNQILKYLLVKNLLPKYFGRINILGATENTNIFMSKADILLTDATSNTIMEAVMCNLPIISLASLSNKSKNLDYISKNNLGIICKDIRGLKHLIINMISDNFQELLDIKKSIQKHRNPYASIEIAKFLINYEIEKAP